MSEAQLSILNYALLAVVYLFFGRVLWAVWSEVRGPRPAAAHHARSAAVGTGAERVSRREHRRGAPRWLKVLQPEVRKGAAYPIEGEVVIGRSSEASIMLPDDTFASSLHARVWVADGVVWLEDLGSTNGTMLNGQRVSSPVRLNLGDRVTIGNTVFETD